MSISGTASDIFISLINIASFALYEVYLLLKEQHKASEKLYVDEKTSFWLSDDMKDLLMIPFYWCGFIPVVFQEIISHRSVLIADNENWQRDMRLDYSEHNSSSSSTSNDDSLELDGKYHNNNKTKRVSKLGSTGGGPKLWFDEGPYAFHDATMTSERINNIFHSVGSDGTGTGGGGDRNNSTDSEVDDVISTGPPVNNSTSMVSAAAAGVLSSPSPTELTGSLSNVSLASAGLRARKATAALDKGEDDDDEEEGDEKEEKVEEEKSEEEEEEESLGPIGQLTPLSLMGTRDVGGGGGGGSMSSFIQPYKRAILLRQFSSRRSLLRIADYENSNSNNNNNNNRNKNQAFDDTRSQPDDGRSQAGSDVTAPEPLHALIERVNAIPTRNICTFGCDENCKDGCFFTPDDRARIFYGIYEGKRGSYAKNPFAFEIHTNIEYQLHRQESDLKMHIGQQVDNLRTLVDQNITSNQRHLTERFEERIQALQLNFKEELKHQLQALKKDLIPQGKK